MMGVEGAEDRRHLTTGGLVKEGPTDMVEEGLGAGDLIEIRASRRLRGPSDRARVRNHS